MRRKLRLDFHMHLRRDLEQRLFEKVQALSTSCSPSLSRCSSPVIHNELSDLIAKLVEGEPCRSNAPSSVTLKATIKRGAVRDRAEDAYGSRGAACGALSRHQVGCTAVLSIRFMDRRRSSEVGDRRGDKRAVRENALASLKRYRARVIDPQGLVNMSERASHESFASIWTL